MIACPICQVMNNDMARFCAECGQRLAPLPTSAKEPGSTMRLHSPLLGEPEPPAPQSDRRSRPIKENILLNQDDRRRLSDQPPEPPAARQSSLHSPLLDERKPSKPGPERKRKPAAPPPVDYSAASDDFSARPNRGLHSPLLDGEEPTPTNYDYGYSQRATGRPPHLRSPLLGEPLDYAEAEFFEEDDPNVLRSPLLASKLPLVNERTPKAPPEEAAPANQPPPQAGQPPISRLPGQVNPGGPSTLPLSAPRRPAPMPDANQPSALPPPSPSAIANQLGSSPLPAASQPSSHAASSFQPVSLSASISLPEGSAGQTTASSPTFPAPSTSSPRSKLESRLDQPSPVPTTSSGPGYLQLLAAPLVVAALFKIWLISQCLSQWSLVADQATQLLALLTLAIICASSGKPKP